MSSKGRRYPETRGTYPRCQVVGCKRKEVREGRCAAHAVLKDRYGNVFDPASKREQAQGETP